MNTEAAVGFSQNFEVPQPMDNVFIPFGCRLDRHDVSTKSTSTVPDKRGIAVRFPIRYQLMLPFSVVALASLLAVGAFHARLATEQTKSRIENQLQGVVRVLEESSFPLTDAVLRQIGGLANAEFVLADHRQRTIAASNSTVAQDLPARDFRAQSIEHVALGPSVVLDEKPYFHSSVEVARRTNRSQPEMLHILFPQSDFNAAWRAAFLPPLFVGMATVLAVAASTQLIATRLGRTLAGLGRAVQRMAEGDFRQISSPTWNDEARDLAGAVNQTALRLAAYESQIRKTERMRTIALLGAGLAHEMRNAATGCRLAVDLHAQSCHRDPADDTLEVARRQLQRMESRLQQLLQLGKPTLQTNDREIDFARLVGDSLDLIKPSARHARVDIVWDPPGEVNRVVADPVLLEQAVMNLLVNALDAASKDRAAGNQDAFIHVQLLRREQTSELVVTDSGEGPSTKVAEAVFEPFVTEKSEGVGLGLAETKRIIDSYGGSVAWQRRRHSTQFSIHLPLATMRAQHV